jgi:hypothetical protein
VGLVLVSTDSGILEQLAGKVPRLYAGVTPSSLGAVDTGRRLNLPLAFLDNSVFLEKEDVKVHRVLRAIALNTSIGNLAEGETVKEGAGFLLPDREIGRRLCSWPEAFRGTGQ